MRQGVAGFVPSRGQSGNWFGGLGVVVGWRGWAGGWVGGWVPSSYVLSIRRRVSWREDGCEAHSVVGPGFL